MLLMTGLALLAILWIGGFAAYFHFTTERQRENYLLVTWITLLVPAVVLLLIGLAH